MLENKLCSLTKEEIIYCRTIFLKISHIGDIQKKNEFQSRQIPIFTANTNEKFLFSVSKYFSRFFLYLFLVVSWCTGLLSS